MPMIVDADTHIGEPAAMWEHFSPTMYGRRPIVVKVPEDTWYGRRNAFWLIDGAIVAAVSIGAREVTQQRAEFSFAAIEQERQVGDERSVFAAAHEERPGIFVDELIRVVDRVDRVGGEQQPGDPFFPARNGADLLRRHRPQRRRVVLVGTTIP